SCWDLASELQTCVAGGRSDRGDAPVVEEATAVEDDLGDAGGLGPLGDQRADALRRGDTGPVALAAQVALAGARRGERAPGVVVDQLHAEVLVRPEHGQARPGRGAVDLL